MYESFKPKSKRTGRIRFKLIVLLWFWILCSTPLEWPFQILPHDQLFPMAFEKILILDDELIIRESLEAQLSHRGYSVSLAKTIAQAERLMARDQFDLMFIDMRLPDGHGTDLLERIVDLPNSPMSVIITGHGSIESAVKCIQLGAFDYVVKPCSMDQINVILKKAEAYSQLVKVNQYFSNQIQKNSEILGGSLGIGHLRRLIKKVAATEATVLVTGENGTGKELVARELFRLSPRAKQPYIRVNCAAISENLIESEFFGHEKGAFTGASQRREGRFELANNGTILLDEIGEIHPSLQVKLLRVLQEQEFERVGGNKSIRVNVRVIATTNRDLQKAVEKGDFREDLYYRLNVFPISVPPLRQRKEDIDLLAKTFLHSFSRKHGVKIPGFSASAMERLLDHNWPGNVRELENTVERSVILTENGDFVKEEALGLLPQKNFIDSPKPKMTPIIISGGSSLEKPPAHIEESLLNPIDHGPSFLSLEELEKEHIFRALDKTKGKKTQAAAILHISTRTLRNKLKLYRMEGATSV